MARIRQSRLHDVLLALAIGGSFAFLPSQALADAPPADASLERTEEEANPSASPEPAGETESGVKGEAAPLTDPGDPSDDLDTEFSHRCDWLCYAHAYATFKIGRGLRLNNPYRLSTPLGSSAESLSLTAPYSDLGLAMLFGDANGFQQGGLLSLSLAMTGVPQQVLAPGYAALFRVGPRWQARGSLAFPILLQPEANIGMDVSVGAAWMFLAGVGLVSDVVFSLYEGAATDQRAATLIPVLSLQLGLTIDIEVLP